MDIHRCRFVPYPPAAINALAFSHTSGSSNLSQPLRLAIGRSNGDVEIWNPRQGDWIHEKTLFGGKDRSIEGLAWVQDPDEVDDNGVITFGRLRLFTIGYSSRLTEWNLITDKPLQHSSGSHSEVWCICAQPRKITRSKSEGPKSQKQRVSLDEQKLVAGCADGSLVLYSTKDGKLEFEKYITRATGKGSRTLSLTFQNRYTVVAGFSNGTIRAYNVTSGSLIRTMSIGGGTRDAPKDVLVWALECLADGTIISGDSLGQVCFWDSKHYGQLQRIVSHEADILCLAASNNGNILLSGGMDRRTQAYTLEEIPGKPKRWVKSAVVGIHEHDVKAMAKYESKRAKNSLVVSGGLDCQPAVLSLKNFGLEAHKKLPYTTQQPHVSHAQRLIVSWWSTEIHIWRVGSATNQKEPVHDHIATVGLKGEEHISTVAISSCGSYLAAATSSKTRAFRLQLQVKPSRYRLKVHDLEMPLHLKERGAREVRFSPDSKWLLQVDSQNNIRLARFSKPQDEAESGSVIATTATLQRIRREPSVQSSLNGIWGSYDRAIIRTAISSDSRIVAVTDIAGYIESWTLEGVEDPNKKPVETIRTNSSTNSAASNSDSDSGSSSNTSSDSEASSRSKGQKKRTLFFGQYWKSNPASRSLPRLPVHALIISFRLHNTQDLIKHSTNGGIRMITNGDFTAAHSPSREDRLFVLTASHDIYEYHMLNGRLTDWSRRNQPQSDKLPESFRRVSDRAQGCIWELQHSPSERNKIWLYGSTWLCMFDLDQDMHATQGDATELEAQDREHERRANTPQPSLNDTTDELQPEQRPTKKRKHSPSPAPPHNRPHDSVRAALRGKRHATSFAGGPVRHGEELMTGLRSPTIVKLDMQGNEIGRYKVNDTTSKLPPPAVADPSSSSEGSDNEAPYESDYESDASRHDGIPKENGQVHKTAATQLRPPAFYMTMRYRPIVAVCPLAPPTAEEPGGNGDDTKTGEPQALANGIAGGLGAREPRPLEVALIERPPWDLDLPPRFESKRDRREG